MIDVSEIVNDPDFSQAFMILRSSGSWVKGVWQNTTADVPSYGAMQPASSKDVEMVPEGDRIRGMVTVWSTARIYTTETTGSNDTDARISDLIVWHGENYRVLQVEPWQDNGYQRAIAVRMAGE